MTTGSRFDRQLPAILEDLYLGPSPDYRDEVLAAATRSRQRPAWAFPGRWLPMADIASPSRVRATGSVANRRGGPAHRRAPDRGDRDLCRHPSDATPTAVRRRRGNGLIAYAVARRHLRRRIRVSGSVTADRHGAASSTRNPVFAPDGTHLAFRRPVEGQRSAGRGHRRRQARWIGAARRDGDAHRGRPEAARVVAGFELDPGDRAERRRGLAVRCLRQAPVQTILTDRLRLLRPFRPPDGTALFDRQCPRRQAFRHRVRSGDRTRDRARGGPRGDDRRRTLVARRLAGRLQRDADGRTRRRRGCSSSARTAAGLGSSPQHPASG